MLLVGMRSIRITSWKDEREAESVTRDGHFAAVSVHLSAYQKDPLGRSTIHGPFVLFFFF